MTVYGEGKGMTGLDYLKKVVEVEVKVPMIALSAIYGEVEVLKEEYAEETDRLRRQLDENIMHRQRAERRTTDLEGLIESYERGAQNEAKRAQESLRTKVLFHNITARLIMGQITPEEFRKELPGLIIGKLVKDELLPVEPSYGDLKNRKIPAIKLLREVTGLGLKEAKDWWEAYIEAEGRVEIPEDDFDEEAALAEDDRQAPGEGGAQAVAG